MVVCAEPAAEKNELAEAEMGEIHAEEGKEVLKLTYEEMKKRTRECKESIDSLHFTLNSLALKAQEAKEREGVKEFTAVLRDYNSFKGDLDVMQAILDLAELIEDERFMEYFNLMANAYEHLKGDFILKNELFLERLSKLKDKDALGYEKKLYSLFCKYFEYDLWQDEQTRAEPEIDDSKQKVGKKCRKAEENRVEK